MDVKVIINYKVVHDLGLVEVGSIFALRLVPAAIKDVSICAIGAAKELAIVTDVFANS